MHRSLPDSRGSRGVFCLPGLPVPVDLCRFWSGERAQLWVEKMLMGWLCNWHCLWAAGRSSALEFMTPERSVQSRTLGDPAENTRGECLNHTGSFTCFGRLQSLTGGANFPPSHCIWKLNLNVMDSGSPQLDVWRFMSVNSTIILRPLTRGYNQTSFSCPTSWR